MTRWPALSRQSPTEPVEGTRAPGGVPVHAPGDSSRTADLLNQPRLPGQGRAAQAVGFTHDRELPGLLPGVAPIRRRAEILAISVVTVQRSFVASCRTLWDQTALLAQLQIDPADLTAR